MTVKIVHKQYIFIALRHCSHILDYEIFGGAMKSLFLILVLILSTSLLAGPSSVIVDGCQKYTSSPELQNLCLSLRVEPKVSRICFEKTITEELERECLAAQGLITKEIIRGCNIHTSNYDLEVLCQKLRVSPENARVCKKSSMTLRQEESCLYALRGKAE